MKVREQDKNGTTGVLGAECDTRRRPCSWPAMQARHPFLGLGRDDDVEINVAVDNVEAC
jgi:hypothetical protein